jgi:threonyl-tRNA synthetase
MTTASKPRSDYKSSDLYRIRHSAAHVLADAVLEMFPDGKVGIGPPIADGFYYDFMLPRSLTPEDLEKIESRMKEIIAGGEPFVRSEVDAADARERFAHQPFKLELIDDILGRGADEYGEPLAEGEQPVLSTYTMGKFEDLCSGPHVERTSLIDPDAIKLLNVAGAYWRGDEKRPMLQRIYGTA